MKRHLPILTNSALKTWRACPRKYRFRYVDGYEAVDKGENLTFGTLVHAMLEVWWLWHMRNKQESSGECQPGDYNVTGFYDNPLDAALGELEDEAFINVAPFSKAKADAMIRAYHVRWEEWAKTVTVLGVEMEFTMPLVNPATGYPSRLYQLGGKLDLLLQLADGTISIVEHKTSSEDFSAGSAYRSRLMMDGQVTAYFAGAEALGYMPTICTYDVLGKPKLKPLQANKSRTFAETPDEYRNRCIEAIAQDPDSFLAHVDLVRLDNERREWELEAWQQAQSINSAKTSNAFVRNTDACFSYGRPCEFYPICTSTGSIDDTSMYRKLENVNVELSNAT